EVLAASRLLPDVEFLITGDVRRCPRALHDSAGPNVVFTGYLRGGDYLRSLEQADVVLVLTRHPKAVNRAAYEGVYAGRPLIISDGAAMTPLFPYAVHTSNEAANIAAAIRSSVERHAELVAAAPAALAMQNKRWHDQLEELRVAIGEGSGSC